MIVLMYINKKGGNHRKIKKLVDKTVISFKQYYNIKSKIFGG